jgi:hypothetical protein
MRKLFVVLFTIGLLLGASAPAMANKGRDHTGNPGPGDNCTALFQPSNDNALSHGKSWHACD